MKNIPKILKAMFAVFFALQIIFYTNLYANSVDVTKLDNYLDKLEMNDENIFSLSVTEKGNPVYVRSIGFTDTDLKFRSNINTRYRIGELSKTFTSVIIMQMVDEKMIQLGTPISRFFPEIPNGGHISIKDLLSHRINIMSYLPGGKFYYPIKSDFVFEELLKGEALSTEYGFSDANYLMLGMIVEKISGQNYSDVIKERITDALGLMHTSSLTHLSGDEVIGKWDLNSLEGAGSIASTPGDLSKFMNALFFEKLISDKMLKTLLGFDNGVNLGLSTFRYGGRTGYGYSGTMDNYNSQMIYFPSDSICISFSTKTNANNTMEELVRIIYGS